MLLSWYIRISVFSSSRHLVVVHMAALLPLHASGRWDLGMKLRWQAGLCQFSLGFRLNFWHAETEIRNWRWEWPGNEAATSCDCHMYIIRTFPTGSLLLHAVPIHSENDKFNSLHSKTQCGKQITSSHFIKLHQTDSQCY